MRTLVTGKQMKAVDAHAITTIGIPSMVLMERAAFAVAREVKGILKEEAGRLASGASVWSVCGTGNNGADGIAAARMLFLEGVSAGVVLIGQPEKGTEEFLQQLKIARNLGMEILSREQGVRPSHRCRIRRGFKPSGAGRVRGVHPADQRPAPGGCRGMRGGGGYPLGRPLRHGAGDGGSGERGFDRDLRLGEAGHGALSRAQPGRPGGGGEHRISAPGFPEAGGTGRGGRGGNSIRLHLRSRGFGAYS